MPRKYFRCSIQELEVLFRDQKDSITVLRELLDELAHRTTDRAARLRNRVTDRITALRKEAQKETLKEPPRVPPHPPRPISRPHEEPVSGSPHIQPDRTVPANEASRTASKMEQQPSLPSVANRPEEVLSAWTALEVLSPPSYIRTEDLAGGDRTRIVSLNESVLPWERGEWSRQKQRLYYQIVLGSIKMEPAVTRLIELYGDTDQEKKSARGKAVLAIVVVNSHGQLVESLQWVFRVSVGVSCQL